MLYRFLLLLVATSLEFIELDRNWSESEMDVGINNRKESEIIVGNQNKTKTEKEQSVIKRKKENCEKM